MSIEDFIIDTFCLVEENFKQLTESHVYVNVVVNRS